MVCALYIRLATFGNMLFSSEIIIVINTSKIPQRGIIFNYFAGRNVIGMFFIRRIQKCTNNKVHSFKNVGNKSGSFLKLSKVVQSYPFQQLPVTFTHKHHNVGYHSDLNARRFLSKKESVVILLLSIFSASSSGK